MIQFNGSLHAFLVNDCNENDLIMTGYLRRCWKGKELTDIGELLFELIGLIINFYTQQFVHLIRRYNGHHWKINLDDILPC